MTGILCSLPMIGAPTAEPPADPLAVSLNKSSLSKTATTSTISTGNVTATGSGGTSPYTYSWSRRSGDSNITATKSSSATTAFQRTGCAEGTSYSATWRCTVTDGAGDTVTSSNVTITIEREAADSGGGGGGTFMGVDDSGASNIGVGSSKTASWSINSDGTYTGGTWNSDSGVGSSYEVKMTVSSGAISSGTTGSWLALSSNRSWAVTDSTQDGNAESATLSLQIRQVGTTTVLDTATITLTANALSSS